MKKKILFIFISLILLSGCSKSNQKNELNVLNWSSYIPDEVINDFENETGIDVNYGTYSSNEELLAKVSSTKLGTYDLIFPSDYMISILKAKKLISKIDKSKLSNFDNLNPDYLNMEFDKGNHYSVPFLAATTVMIYDTSVIKENIKSYNDLLNSKYKNDIVLIDDQRIIIGAALLANGYDMNSTNKNELNIAKNWLLKLKKNVKAFDSDSPKTFLMTKEVDIGFMWNAEAVLAMGKNKNLKVVYPKEGFALSMDNMVIMNQAKNKANAYKFINYILRADVMKKIIDAYPYKNLNAATSKKLNSSYLNNIAANTPENEMKNSHFVENIGSSITDYDKLWAEIK